MIILKIQILESIKKNKRIKTKKTTKIILNNKLFLIEFFKNVHEVA